MTLVKKGYIQTSGSFLLDKYKPQTVNDFSFNIDKLEQVLHMANYDDIPNLIIAGPHGGGKRTLVNILLEKIYDQGINNLSKCTYSISGSSAKKNVEILQSDYHIVIEPTNTNHDKYILQEIIKQYAMHRSFNFFKTQRVFKTIVILNIENLANNSQAALRRTMELYAKTCRFIMVCNNLSKVFDPLRSRCRIICVPLATQENVYNIISKISLMENITISHTKKKTIISNANGNLKKSIWMLDAIKYGVDGDIGLDRVFDKIIRLLFKTLVNTKNVTKTIFEAIRSLIYPILITNIDGSTVITTILDKLINIINDDEICIQFIQSASDSEHHLIHGRRDIIHIDPFITRIMQICTKNKAKLIDIIRDDKFAIKKNVVKKPQIRKVIRKNSVKK